MGRRRWRWRRQVVVERARCHAEHLAVGTRLRRKEGEGCAARGALPRRP